MPLDPDLARLLRDHSADPSAPRPTETTLKGARASHEHDAANFCPPSQRAQALVERRHLPTAVRDIAVNVYRPLSTNTSMPTVIWFHGGGWTTGSLTTGDILARELCANCASVVVSVDYRLSPEHPWPAAVEDATAAIAWIAANIDEFGHRSDLLAVGGDSSGGNIAAAAAQACRATAQDLAAQILIYPFLDLDLGNLDTYPSMEQNGVGYYVTLADLRWCVANYLPDGSDPRAPLVSPLLASSVSGLPSAVIAVAEYDPLRDQGVRYAERLRAAGIRVIDLPGQGLIHGYADMSGKIAAARAELARVCARVTQLLQASAADGTGTDHMQAAKTTGQQA